MSMTDLTWGLNRRFIWLAELQDIIGWQIFLEGMISKEWVQVQRQFYELQGGRYRPGI